MDTLSLDTIERATEESLLYGGVCSCGWDSQERRCVLSSALGRTIEQPAGGSDRVFIVTQAQALDFSEETLNLAERDLTDIESLGFTSKQTSQFRH